MTSVVGDRVTHRLPATERRGQGSASEQVHDDRGPAPPGGLERALRPRVRLRVIIGAMDVLSSRVLLHPTDPERSRAFYRDALGLAVYREFGSGPQRGTVFFLGGGFLELSGRAAAPPAPGIALWLQVRELAAVRRELGERGVPILREPRREPWGLLEMWIADPDGVRICVVEVPEEHPLRRRD
jgi:catechol 2,3-dioxygenase-like lactoylglutathione lyase family enzyme